jgi:hypothetical protein
MYVVSIKLQHTQNRVVILGVRRLTCRRSRRAGGQAGSLAHYAGRGPGVLDILSKYSLKIPQIYSNMLKYTRIYSNILGYTRIFPCQASAKVYQAKRVGGRAGA